MLAHQTVRLALSVAAATVVASLAFESSARACEPNFDETTLVIDGLGDSQSHRVERVPRNYGYVFSNTPGRETERVAIMGAPIPLFRDREPLPVGPLERSSRTVQVEDRIDSTPPGRPSLRSGVLQKRDWGCDTTTYSLTLELGGDVVDDQTPPGEITYAIFGGTTREQAESEAQVTQFRVATGTTIRMGNDAPELAWFSVAAIDLAGNIGPRSEALEVAREDATAGDGCSAAAAASPPSVSSLLAFGVIFALAGVRRTRPSPRA